MMSLYMHCHKSLPMAAASKTLQFLPTPYRDSPKLGLKQEWNERNATYALLPRSAAACAVGILSSLSGGNVRLASVWIRISNARVLFIEKKCPASDLVFTNLAVAPLFCEGAFSERVRILLAVLCKKKLKCVFFDI